MEVKTVNQFFKDISLLIDEFFLEGFEQLCKPSDDDLFSLGCLTLFELLLEFTKDVLEFTLINHSA